MSTEVPASEAMIAARIRTLRDLRVMLDADLADLYGVRFPPDFMFQLSQQEVSHLKSQSVILPPMALRYWGRRRKAPYAFTERGRQYRDHACLRALARNGVW
jgi:hypothetical protein